jgi:hypothetical protein
MTSKYSVTIEYSDTVAVSVADSPTAYNTARAIAVAIAKANAGAVVELDRGHCVERYIGEKTSAVVVRRCGARKRAAL